MEFLEIERLIALDAMEILLFRYNILDIISKYEPIGRRKLIEKLKEPERKIRNHLEYLSNNGLILSDKRGVMLRQLGKEALKELHGFVLEYNQFYNLENELKEILNISQVHVVSGNSNTEGSVLNRAGMKAGRIISQSLNKAKIIAISGGSSTFSVANNIIENNYKNITVVPVRGALGHSNEYQANYIARKLAGRLNSQYKQLSVPDYIDKEVSNYLKNHPDIKKVTSYYDNIDILIFGIGVAKDTAKRRMLAEEEIEKINKLNGVCEALGYYIDEKGDIIKSSDGIGLELSQIKKIPLKIAVCVGEKKISAIKGFTSFMEDLILVTDEAAALALVKNNK